MSTWRTITAGEVSPYAALRSALVVALNNNLLAVAAGAAGAPRVVGRGLRDMVHGHVTASPSTPITGLAGVGHILIIGEMQWGAAQWTLTAGYSADNGTTWGADQVVLTQMPTGQGSGPATLAMNIQTGAVVFVPAYDVGGTFAPVTVTHTVPAVANAVRLSGAFRGMVLIIGGRV